MVLFTYFRCIALDASILAVGTELNAKKTLGFLQKMFSVLLDDVGQK